MRNSKKWMTAVLTAAMVVSQVVPAFASSASVTGDGTTSGTANILAYSVDRIVVPTTLKVALNPNGYALMVGYEPTEDTAITTGKTYYTKDFDGTKWVYNAVTNPVVGDIAKYYEADVLTTDNQVVSLNYGIANKSTKDKVVSVNISVTQDTNDIAGKLPIQFVDSAAAATYKGETGGEASQNEMKMYLGVVASTAAPTTDTFVRVTASGFTDADKNTTVFYEKSAAGVYTVTTAGTGGKFASLDDFKAAINTDPITKLYKQTDVIGPEITGLQLSDVVMTAASEGEVGFAEGKENKANASIGFKLPKATYAVEEGDYIEAFDTTQEALANKLQLKDLNGTAGFTIKGAMNKMVDWTRADTVALKIQPTYKVSDADGSETYIDDEHDGANPFNQVTVGPQLTVTAGGLFTISGLNDNYKFKDLTATYNGTAYSMTDTGRASWTPGIPAEDSTGSYSAQLVDAWLGYLAGAETTVTLMYLDGDVEKTVVKTVTISN